MAPRKEIARNEPAVVTNGVALPPIRTSRLPRHLRFPLLVIISLSLNVAALSIVADGLGYELGSVSRSRNEPWQVAAYLGWKVAELAVGWYGKYDDLDITWLTLLTHAPVLYLLQTFYFISPTTALTNLAIDLASVALPTKLLRPRSALHNPNAPKSAVPNRNIIHSFQVILSTTLLGTAIYSVVLYTALKAGLLTFMVTHFDLPTVAPAHSVSLIQLVAALFPVGWAVRGFLLAPSLGVQTHLGDAKASAFNPATASLAETLRHNVWGWSKQTKVLLTRTAVVAAMVAANTTVRVSALEGTDAVGALGYAGVWVLAGALSAVMFGWVGDVGDDVVAIKEL
ncbi:hypothetical protein AOQ84DRAFT_293849 [Glonium stellatum]|uniref:Uncharacterized protein n=1 Tax=Glonium stellatum TaxID=574774 RepID=A0A8E2F023_9PEZI|nr:hypothetical protein AOQ84DRAFT_293849 [Glonium stellatum]